MWNEDLSQLQKGDRVAIYCSHYSSNWYELDTVAKITPTGQIVTGSHGRFKPDGHRIGDRDLSGTWSCLRLATEGRVRSAHLHQARQFIKSVQWSNVPEDKLLQVQAILKGDSNG